MAIAFIQEFKIQGDDRSTTNYDAINERLNARGNPPEGLPHLRRLGDPRAMRALPA